MCRASSSLRLTAKPKFKVDHLVACFWCGSSFFHLLFSTTASRCYSGTYKRYLTYLASTSSKTYRLRSVFVASLTIFMLVTFAAFFLSLMSTVSCGSLVLSVFLWCPLLLRVRVTFLSSTLLLSYHPVWVTSSVHQPPIYVNFFTEFPLSLSTFLLVFRIFYGVCSSIR